MTVRRITAWLDEFQQRRAWLAFPVAVLKKFSEDQGGNLSALIAYYAFLSLFPLLLLLVTVLGLVLRNNPDLQQRVLHSALSDFPVIGGQLKSNIHSLNRSGVGLLVGLAGSLLGALGLASALQNACNTVWGVPRDRRPTFSARYLRSTGLVLTLGLGVLAGTVAAGVGQSASVAPLAARVLVLALSLVLNVGVFLLAFRLCTAAEVPTWELRFGALAAALVWQVLQVTGGYLVAHELRHASPVYGTFATVLALLAWLYIQARVVVLALESDAVRAKGLWPRRLVEPDGS